MIGPCLGILLIAISAPVAAAEFEVAAIHPSRPFTGGTLAPAPVRFTIEYEPSGVRIVNFSIRDLIQEAAQGPPRRVEASSQEIQRLLNQRFDISAQAAEPSSRAALREMIGDLLVKRFHLQQHRQIRPEEVYRLIPRKGGTPQPATPSDSNPHYRRRGDTLWYLDASPESFAETLTGYMRLRVIDATGLTGLYDFPIPIQASGTDQGREVLIDSLQRIGLDLARGRADIEYVIVDAVTAPSEN